MNSREKLLNIARAEVGYLEKKSNMYLDSKTENAGMNNFTKYARDLYPDLQGQPWCDMFVDWVFMVAFGKSNAKKLLGGFSAYTPTSAGFFKKQNRFIKEAKVGNPIFFKNEKRINHTGVVEGVDDKRVYTIEGNTSSTEGVVANGGGVFKKSYLLTDPRIAGYGDVDWSIVANEPSRDYERLGWQQDSKGWWYAYGHKKGQYHAGKVVDIEGKLYAFNSEGYLVKNPTILTDEKGALKEVKEGICWTA